jgi:hypothetical protein
LAGSTRRSFDTAGFPDRFLRRLSVGSATVAVYQDIAKGRFGRTLVSKEFPPGQDRSTSAAIRSLGNFDKC